MLKLCFYTQLIITPICFDPSLSSSMSYLTSIPKEKLYVFLIWAIITTCKTTISASYEPVLQCGKQILYLQTFYGQLSIYLIVHLCFYICFIDVKYLPEDDQGRSKHVGVMTVMCKSIILTLMYLLVLLYELYITALTWITLRLENFGLTNIFWVCVLKVCVSNYSLLISSRSIFELMLWYI